MHLRLVKDNDTMPVKNPDAFRLVKHFALGDMPDLISRHVYTVIAFFERDFPAQWPWGTKHSDYYPDESDVSFETFDAMMRTHHRPVCDWLIQHGAVPGESIMID